MKLVPLTEEHIANGSPAKCAECPIALALKRCRLRIGVEHRYRSRVRIERQHGLHVHVTQAGELDYALRPMHSSRDDARSMATVHHRGRR